jgi:hypothetical protein
MDSSNKKAAVGCALAAIGLPLLLAFGIFVYAAASAVVGVNEIRVQRNMSWWQVAQEWRSQSAATEAGLTPAQRERRDLNDAAWQAACPIAIFMIGGYFVPLIIAIRRKHPQVAAIGAVNIFLGWSFLGWVIALTWSLTNENGPAPQIPPRSPQPPRPRSVAPVRKPTSSV